jgi:hypothetical protein
MIASTLEASVFVPPTTRRRNRAGDDLLDQVKDLSLPLKPWAGYGRGGAERGNLGRTGRPTEDYGGLSWMQGNE